MDIKEELNAGLSSEGDIRAEKTTPLHWAAHDGDVNRIDTIMKEVLEPVDKFGRTPLLRAAWSGYADAFYRLLRYGASGEASDYRGRTALHLVSKQGRIDLLQSILNKINVSDLEPRDNYERSPLHLAALKGQLEAAKALVGAGCNINIQDGWDRTPLHLAKKEGEFEVAAFLEESGADTGILDVNGKTAEELGNR